MRNFVNVFLMIAEVLLSVFEEAQVAVLLAGESGLEPQAPKRARRRGAKAKKAKKAKRADAQARKAKAQAKAKKAKKQARAERLIARQEREMIRRAPRLTRKGPKPVETNAKQAFEAIRLRAVTQALGAELVNKVLAQYPEAAEWLKALRVAKGLVRKTEVIGTGSSVMVFPAWVKETYDLLDIIQRCGGTPEDVQAGQLPAAGWKAFRKEVENNLPARIILRGADLEKQVVAPAALLPASPKLMGILLALGADASVLKAFETRGAKDQNVTYFVSNESIPLANIGNWGDGWYKACQAWDKENRYYYYSEQSAVALSCLSAATEDVSLFVAWAGTETEMRTRVLLRRMTREDDGLQVMVLEKVYGEIGYIDSLKNYLKTWAEAQGYKLVEATKDLGRKVHSGQVLIRGELSTYGDTLRLMKLPHQYQKVGAYTWVGKVVVGDDEVFFWNIKSVAVDAAGNVYVVDTDNHRIRKVSPAGVVTTLAGSSQGYADGTGTTAQFNYPQGIAVDSAGNVYITDAKENYIRKVTPAGVVTTLAGSTLGCLDGTGTTAQFNYPTGIAVDSAGNVYVADQANHRIRKITPTGEVTTLAGSTQGYAYSAELAAKFNEPRSVAVDSAGNVYVADSFNNCIRKVSPTGVVTTLAGSAKGYADDTGAAAKFAFPSGVAVDRDGNVYVADTYNHRIRKVTPAGVVTTLAGSIPGYADGTGAAAQFNQPSGVAVDSDGNVYVADAGNHRIRKITPAGEVTTVAG